MVLPPSPTIGFAQRPLLDLWYFGNPSRVFAPREMVDAEKFMFLKKKDEMHEIKI